MKRNKLQKPLALLLALVLMATLAPTALAEGESDTTPPADSNKMEVVVGSTTQMPEITPELLNVPAIPEGATYNWLIRDPNQGNEPTAAISLEGSGTQVRVIARRTGVVTLTVNVMNGTDLIASKTWEITVKYAPTTGIYLIPEFSLDTVDSNIPREMILTPTLTPPGFADPKSVEWKVEPENVVQLEEVTDSEESMAMRVTTLRPGMATITATSGDYSATSIVTVMGIAISTPTQENVENFELALGSTIQLTADKYGNIANDIIWTSANESVAEVDQTGLVTANSLGSTQIVATAGRYQTVCEVVVVENTAHTIECETEAGRPLKFDTILEELNECAKNQLKGNDLSYITNVRVDTDEGILYYRYISANDTGFGVGGVERYYMHQADGSRMIEDLTFVPRTGLNSKADVSYIGYDDEGNSFTGHISITVTGSADIEYATDAATPVTMHADDFTQICRQRNGRDFTYVSFYLPMESQGTLYYNYKSENLYSAKVDSTTQYKRSGSPYLENVTFVPNKSYSGTVKIAYRGEDTVGLPFSGTMYITVTSAGGTNGSSVNYTVYGSNYVPFDAFDFDKVCREETSSELDYVRFTLPDSSQGTLYYGYRGAGSYGSRIAETDRLYAARDLYLSNVSFVPVDGYQGVVYIDFSGYSTEGDRFSGQVCIQVTEEGESNEVTYVTGQGQPVTFTADNFNEFCQALTGDTLYRLRFTTPNGGQGKLSYVSSGTPMTVTSDMYFYRGANGNNPLISDVTFTPAGAVTGLVRLNYTGYSVGGRQYSGTVYINVERVDNLTVKIDAASGGATRFTADKFNDASISSTGSELSYISFTELPAEGAGTLYYDYGETGEKAAAINTSYYYTGTQNVIDNLTFVAGRNYTGTTEFGYTGVGLNGRTFEGVVQIRVAMPEADPIQYAGSANPLTVNASSFNRVCTDITGRNISYIQFTKLPGETAGRLYYNYSSPVMTGSPVTTGTSYYFSAAPEISRLRFVPKAGYTGSVTAEYTGYNTEGQRFTGKVVFIMSPNYGSVQFSDMGNHSWAHQAVDFLYSMGVVNGVGDNCYAPANPVMRRDFVLMLCNAFRLDMGGGTPFPDVPQDSYYALAVSTARALGIIQGSDGYFRPNSELTRQDAMVMIYRTLNTVGISLPDTSGLSIESFRDSGNVSSYAREAVDALIRSGTIVGSGDGRINPKSNITRAEMAVILHRVLTA